MDISSRPFRRTLVVGVAWAVVFVGLVVTSPQASGQEAAVEPGLGSAFAQGYKLDPRSGQLSLGIGYGVSLAGHQNLVAQAESRSVDLGIIGDTLTGEGCDGGAGTFSDDQLPQHLTTRSTDDDAGTTKQEEEYAVDKRVLAEPTPLARSSARTAAVGEPGMIEIGSTESRTESGVIDGLRVARAVTDVSSITIAGGLVTLRGLRWEAIYQTAPDVVTDATFSVEGIEVEGASLPIPDDNPLEPLAEANAVLEPLGFTLQPPATRVEAGIAFVDPLRIGVIPSEIREGALAPVFGGVQPVRESIVDILLEDCSNATYVLVADIVLGSVTGAGSLGVEVGGVTATSSELRRTSFLGDIGGGFGGRVPPVPTGDSTAAPAAPGAAPSTPPGITDDVFAPPTPQPASGAEETAAPVADARPIAGERGGALAVVGLGGLGLLAALAEGDRRKMRRAQRTTPMEVTV